MTDHLSYPFEGWIVWLTHEQGGRRTGPPLLRQDYVRYAATGFVPPATARTGIASFVLRDFEAEAWRSRAQGGWLVPDNPDVPTVEPGSVIVVTEGPRVVAYFTVDTIGPEMVLDCLDPPPAR